MATAQPTGDLGGLTPSTPGLDDAFKEGDSNINAGIPAGHEASVDAGGDFIERQRLGLLGRKDDKRAPIPLGVTSHPSTTYRSGSPGVALPRSSSPKFLPTSPGRLQQASPRLASPTSSLIFERNVQEDVVPAAASPAIPAHIATENHIPPVLEVASKAITDDHLDPDSVEIVTHASHQPAAAVVTAGSDMPLTPLHPTASTVSGIDQAPQLPSPELSTSPIVVPVPLSNSVISNVSPPTGSDIGANQASEENSNLGGSAPNYGSIDTTDVRRLSFISFADVVHAEQAAGDTASLRDSVVLSQAQAYGSPNAVAARSPSPIRSPASPSLSAGSGTGSSHIPFGDLEGSPSNRARTSSPQDGLSTNAVHSPSLHGIAPSSPPPIGNTGGEISIETLGQTLRNNSDANAGRMSVVFSETSEAEKR